MKRVTRRLACTGLLTGLFTLVTLLFTSGAADAGIALNHNETVLRDC